MSERVDASTLRLALFTDTFTPQVNGVVRTLERLVAAVHERGGVARVFTVADPASTSLDQVRRYPSVSFWAYKELRLAWPSQARVREELAEFAPTLVHAATEFGVGLAGRSAARALDVPFVSSYHTNFASYAQYYRLGALARPGWAFMRWFHNSGLRTYCPTQAIIDDVSRKGFERTAVWSRGVDSARYAPRYRSEVCANGSEQHSTRWSSRMSVDSLRRRGFVSDSRPCVAYTTLGPVV